MKGDIMEERRYLLPCDCGCGIMEFIKDDGYVYMSYFPNGFYAYQHSIIKRIKAIWNLIMGKEYRLFDIVVKEKDFDKFFKELEKEKETK